MKKFKLTEKDLKRAILCSIVPCGWAVKALKELEKNKSLGGQEDGRRKM